VVTINGENIHWASPEVRGEVESFLTTERELPPEEQIVFHNGGYHIDDLASRMARIDWCIVPSTWWEIFGLVISEAWMVGKPVICRPRRVRRTSGARGERVAVRAWRSSGIGGNDKAGGGRGRVVGTAEWRIAWKHGRPVVSSSPDAAASKT
jgi:hypothetical protein